MGKRNIWNICNFLWNLMFTLVTKYSKEDEDTITNIFVSQ
jgi:hypothetical protein